ncbi:MAG: SDR family oxidoreductase [Candidatus Helarchaeota archaeon]|nr:SDR family oxidoreductase [Candidatus Helarchaeota archaeon]
MKNIQNKRLLGKIALITGAGSGIGRATAIRFAKEGAKVIVNDINEEGVKETLRMIEELGGEAYPAIADVSNEEEVKKMVENTYEKGEVDILFANAGIGDYNPFLRTPFKFWDRMFKINFFGVVFVAREVIKRMQRRKVPDDQLRGKIIITSSGAAKEPQAKMSAYSASKAALVALTVSLAKEFGKKRISVNCICPGTILTPMYGAQTTKEQLEGLDGQVHLEHKPVGDPEDVANLVFFLASNDSDYISGQAINVTGGMIFH